MNVSLQRLEALFAEAVALPASACAEFLDRECAGDAELRARVEGMLRTHDGLGGFLETAVVPGLAEAAPGARIGRYKLLEKIGEGGVGVVFMAEQEEPVRRRVAVKVIKPGMDSREVIARFESERQALALMDHPNIARVLDAGAAESGRPFFVMELVRGIKITDYCDQNQLSTEERLRLFLPVCGAIQHAHQKSVVHRDIKPSNLLVTLHDGVAVPKVIDFGIAKATQGRLTDKTLFTAFAQFIGTPAYMSPEQAEMSGLDIDTRSDVYSLGVLLYELLTGRTPFDAKELNAAGLDEIRKRIRETEPPRLATRLHTLGDEALTMTARNRRVEPPKLLAEIRGDLEWIVGRCLEKDRARRYQTANALAMDIQRHLDNEPVVARPPGTAYLLRKLIRRHRLAFAAGAIVASGLLASLSLSTAMFFRERAARAGEATQRARAEMDKRDAQLEAARNAQVAQFMKDMLRGVGDQVARGRDAQLLRELIDQTARQLGSGLAGQPEVEADLRDTLGRVYLDMGDFNTAVAMHEAALGLRRELFGNEHLTVAASLNELGAARGRQGRYTEATRVLAEALALRRRLLGSEHRDVATTLVRIGDLRHREQRRDEAIEALQEGLAIRRKLLGNEHVDVAEALYHLGLAIRLSPAIRVERDNSQATAETLFREALAIQRKRLGPEHAAIGHTLQKLGWTLLNQYNYAEAESVIREALAMQRKLVGDSHPDTALTMNDLAGLCEYAGRLAESEALYRQSWAIWLKTLGNAHDMTALAPIRLGRVLRLQGRIVEAEAAIREGEAILSRTEGGYKNIAMAYAAHDCFKILLSRNEFDEADRVARQAIERGREKQGGFYDTLRADVVEVALHQRKFAEAEVLVTQEPPRLERTHQLLLGIALAGQGRVAEADELLRSAAKGFLSARAEHRLRFSDACDLKDSVELLGRILIDSGQPEKAAEWSREFAVAELAAAR